MNKQLTIPVYLEASSKDGIIKAMLENNAKQRKQFQYTTPMKDGRKWVVWYYADLSLGEWMERVSRGK